MWRRALVERELNDAIRGMTADPQCLHDVARESQKPQPIDHGGRRADLREQLRRVNDAFFAKALERPEWRLRVEAIQAQLATLPEPTPMTLRLATRRLESIGQVWEGMTVSREPKGVPDPVPRGQDEYARARAVPEAVAGVPRTCSGSAGSGVGMVPPTGLEPVLPAPEAGALSTELRGRLPMIRPTAHPR